MREDRDILIQRYVGTFYGDSNWNGVFETTDWGQVFQIGEYEDAALGNSSWLDGDWDGDLEFASSDFVLAYIQGGYDNSFDGLFNG